MSAINREAATQFRIGDRVNTPTNGKGTINGVFLNRCTNRAMAVISLDERIHLDEAHPDQSPPLLVAYDVSELQPIGKAEQFVEGS